MWIRALALMTLPLLSGCGALGALGDATRPLDVYELRAPEGLPVATAPLRREVVIELPGTTGTLETDRILIRPGGLQAQYLPDARWGEETPVMMQTLMLRSLSATEGLLYVGRRPLGAGGDFAIVTDLVDFQAETRGDDGETIVARIAMNVRIVRERDVAIVATRAFASEVASTGSSNDEIIAALDTAAANVMRDFTPWIMASLGRPL